jgi:hypothetical protein
MIFGSFSTYDISSIAEFRDVAIEFSGIAGHIIEAESL